MLDLKPYGAFVENTIRPLLEEFHIFISDLYGYGLHLTKEDLAMLGKYIVLRHMKTIIIQSITNVIITGIICWTAWTISQS